MGAGFGLMSAGAVCYGQHAMGAGNGEGRFTHFEFLNERGETKNVIRSGDKLTMRLYYRANKTLRDLVIGINILTEYGTLLTAINNWATGDDIPVVNVGEAMPISRSTASTCCRAATTFRFGLANRSIRWMF